MQELQCSYEQYKEDTKDHKMHILLDNGTYRHLKFKRDDRSCYYYDIVTYPGYLVISGDMGCYVFSRINDMIDFFETYPREDGTRSYDFGYWAEKLQGNGEYKEFSVDVLKKLTSDRIDTQLEGEGWTDDEIIDLKDDMWSECFWEENEVRCYDALTNYEYHNFKSNRQFQFTDVWDWIGYAKTYTYHYIWCCYAIVDAIQQYKKHLTNVNGDSTL